MNAVTVPSPTDRWPLARVLILILAGAFGGLMLDIRVEHVDVVHEHSIGWLPIIYAGFMTIACLVASALWNRTARLIMIVLFLMAFAIGGVGFYMHNHGNVMGVVKSSVNAWTDPKMTHEDDPPQVAPLAFGGLGVIGIVASLGRFNSRTRPVRPLNR